MATRSENLYKNYLNLSQEIKAVAEAAGRNPSDIHLIAVSKTYPFSDIAALAAHGVFDFGENKAQEIAKKTEEGRQSELPIRWHLIGTLQRNKIKLVVGRVALIHSVHDIKVMDAINRKAEEEGLVQPILLQLNISQEASKHGFLLNEADEAVRHCLEKCPQLELNGFMTMAPYFDQPEDAVPVFTTCHDVYKRWQKELGEKQIHVLSMGMSNDYPQAIRCGATHVRIGTKIFGQRQYL